ncbi:MAG TPA: hypothetical protein LFW20_05185 [Rickettsia endosymbiont of Omalisus fontisbellaquei]|nr:hypothetical protein [Rickettsia endosymbiont of Omalisus fontisbellaquei]
MTTVSRKNLKRLDTVVKPRYDSEQYKIIKCKIIFNY